MKVLIIKLSALGDVLQTLPAVNLLKKFYPKAQIDWLVEKRNSELLLENPLLNRVLLFNKEFFLKPKAFYEFIKELRKTFYEVVLDFQGLLKSGILTFFAKGKYKIGYENHREGSPLFYKIKLPAYDPEKHAVYRYLDLVIQTVNFLNGEIKNPPLERELFYNIPLPEKRPDFSFKTPFILLIAGARWKTKLWPYENWKAFLEITKDLRKEIAFYFIGGPKETELKAFSEEMAQIYDGVFSLVGKITLRELVYLMKKALAVLTVDTGPMHLASILNKPILALFGPTSSGRTGPWSENFIVLREPLFCSPCFKRSCKNPLCMSRLSPEKVKHNLVELLYSKTSVKNLA
ncbi:MAG: glycosyltransferase family 9 protein [Caldimicrobium thiodismutans]